MFVEETEPVSKKLRGLKIRPSHKLLKVQSSIRLALSSCLIMSYFDYH